MMNILIIPVLLICVFSIVSFFSSIFVSYDVANTLNVNIENSKSARYTFWGIIVFVIICVVGGICKLDVNGTFGAFAVGWVYVVVALAWWWLIETAVKFYKTIKS